MGVGMLTAFSVGIESSAGTTTQSGVTPCDFLAILTEGLTAAPNPLESQGLRAQWDIQKAYPGLQTVQGNVAVEVHPDNIGYFFRSFFDTYTFAAAGGFGTHKFIAANGQFQAGSGSDVPTLTFDVYRGPAQIQASAPSSAFRYFGCAANVMNLQIEAGQFLKADFDFLGRGYNRVAAVTPTFPAPRAFLWSTVSVAVGGTASALFESLTIRGNNNMEAAAKLDGTAFAKDVKRNNFRSIEVNGRIAFGGDAEYDTFNAGSQTSLKLHFRSDSAALTLDFPAFQYLTFPLGTQGPGRTTIDFTGKAYLHPGSGSSATFTLVNTRLSSFVVNTNA